MQSSILTASLTVLGGIVIFAVTQIFIKMIVDPLAEFRRIKGRINTALIFHSNVYINPIHFHEDINHKGRADAVSSDLRTLASELMATYQLLSFKSILIALKIIPAREAIHEASRHLIGLSNGVYTYSTYSELKHDGRKTNDDSAKELARILDLYVN